MPYSAVIQPLPVSRRKLGARSSKVAVTSTWVLPNLTRQLPSAWMAKPGTISMVRISSLARPLGRIGDPLYMLLYVGFSNASHHIGQRRRYNDRRIDARLSVFYGLGKTIEGILCRLRC
jgi:hypothetical protein